MDSFDPYLNWLDISRDQRPVNHYRLFGLDVGEGDARRISSGADQAIARVQSFASGEYAAIAERLLAEMAVAKACLLDPQRRSQYDESLRSNKSEVALKSPPPVPGTAPVSSRPGETFGPERQIQSAPPPPGSSSADTPIPGPQQTIASAPPAPGASQALPPRPTITGAPPPPGAPTLPQPGSGPAAPATGGPPLLPTGRDAGGPPPVAPPSGPLAAGGNVVPPAPTPPVAAPPAVPTANPIAQPVPLATPVAAPTTAAPTWAPENRTGSVGTSAAEDESARLPRTPSRTREARSFKRKVRREKRIQFYSIVFGVAAILFGLVVLLVLVAVS